ncbi:MAG TPA: xanthine dehydrogenase family protein subunit M [Acidimicrobiia bacterium]|jgi:carbon-monoxide dehydrogenase medium subunit|nr:xanthine dehydrogenase family protein subunit M [Acidimicrobiia bacterium]
MYPPRFRYEAPKTIEGAINLLSEGAGDAKVLAGGQSLIPLLKLRFASPTLLVDINEISGLDYLDFGADGSIRIGALCRHSALEQSEELKVRQPVMAAAAALVADPIVRNRGTLVGSLCHADPQGDWAAVMVALGGSLVVQGPQGRRTIPTSELVHGPFQNALAHHEIGIEATVPAPQGVPMGGYLKLERRIGDFATVAVAVSVDMQGDSVARAGIGLVAVGPKTIDATDAAASLVGGRITADTISTAADLAAGAAKPRTDHRGSADYKKHIVHTFVTRILTRVAASIEKAA